MPARPNVLWVGHLPGSVQAPGSPRALQRQLEEILVRPAAACSPSGPRLPLIVTGSLKPQEAAPNLKRLSRTSRGQSIKCTSHVQVLAGPASLSFHLLSLRVAGHEADLSSCKSWLCARSNKRAFPSSLTDTATLCQNACFVPKALACGAQSKEHASLPNTACVVQGAQLRLHLRKGECTNSSTTVLVEFVGLAPDEGAPLLMSAALQQLQFSVPPVQASASALARSTFQLCSAQCCAVQLTLCI